jgi:hypothetical protein
MNDTMVTSAIWIAAGGLLLLFLRHRRSRRAKG